MAFAAALDALIHTANLFATIRACLADLCASFAVKSVMVAVATHEVDAGTARGDTVEHQLDVFLLDVITALAQAMARQHVGTNGLALLAVVQAVLHGGCLGCHGKFSVNLGSQSWQSCRGGMECNLHTVLGYNAVAEKTV